MRATVLLVVLAGFIPSDNLLIRSCSPTITTTEALAPESLFVRQLQETFARELRRRITVVLEQPKSNHRLPDFIYGMPAVLPDLLFKGLGEARDHWNPAFNAYGSFSGLERFQRVVERMLAHSQDLRWILEDRSVPLPAYMDIPLDPSRTRAILLSTRHHNFYIDMAPVLHGMSAPDAIRYDSEAWSTLLVNLSDSELPLAYAFFCTAFGVHEIGHALHELGGLYFPPERKSKLDAAKDVLLMKIDLRFQNALKIKIDGAQEDIIAEAYRRVMYRHDRFMRAFRSYERYLTWAKVVNQDPAFLHANFLVDLARDITYMEMNGLRAAARRLKRNFPWRLYPSSLGSELLAYFRQVQTSVVYNPDWYAPFQLRNQA